MDLCKFFRTPGLCSKKELDEVKLFLSNLNDNLKIYIDATGYEPRGKQLESNIDKVDWYLNFNKKENLK